MKILDNSTFRTTVRTNSCTAAICGNEMLLFLTFTHHKYKKNKGIVFAMRNGPYNDLYMKKRAIMYRSTNFISRVTFTYIQCLMYVYITYTDRHAYIHIQTSSKVHPYTQTPAYTPTHSYTNLFI